MRRKDAVKTSLLLPLLVLTLAVVPVHAQSRKPTDLLIHMYLNPDAEFYALELGDIDIVDWSLSKDWIDRWVDPAYDYIRMVDYDEAAWYELTFNHQLWPTGWRNYTENPTVALGGELQPYDPTVQRCVDAKHFRTAVAYLTNVPQYIDEVMKGYGLRTLASKPATIVRWISPNLVEWPYNPATAEAELTAGGFIDYDGDSALEYDEDRDGVGYEELPALEIWGRLDDINSGDSCDLLVAELTAVGIPVNYHKELAWPCYLAVMRGAPPGVNLPANWPDATHWLPFVDTNLDGKPEWLPGMHRFHFYTSRWIARSPVKVQYHDLYVEASATEGNMLFSLNYGGFYVGDGIAGTADDVYDYEYWASITKFGTEVGDGDDPALPTEVLDAIYKCQEIAQEFWPVVPWFSNVANKAYHHNEGLDGEFSWDLDNPGDDTGWFGNVNHANLGPDFAGSNAFSFVNMEHATDTTLDWGFKTEPFTLNIVTAQWLFEWNVLGLIYEPMILHCPWKLTHQYGWLAEPVGPGRDGVLGSAADPGAYYDDVWAETEVWYDPDGIPGTGDERMAVTMRLRDGITFHNGDPVTPEDIKFNALFNRDAGPGVAYGWPTYSLIEYVDTQADDPTLGPRDIKWYFGMPSYWVLYYAGYTGPLNTDIWMTQNYNYGWLYRWPRGSGFVEESWVVGEQLYVRTSAHPGNPCDIAVADDVYIVFEPEDPTAKEGPYTVDDKLLDDDTWIFELSSATAPITTFPEGSRLDEFPGDGTGWDSLGVVWYEPWLEDHDGDGDVDLKEDGTGPWIFEDWNIGNTILLSREPTPEMGGPYHKTEAEIRGYLIRAFHSIGNVNYDGALHEAEYLALGIQPDMTISTIDLSFIARALGTNKDDYPHGIAYNYYNEDCDFDKDGEVWAYDFVVRLGKNFGIPQPF